MSASIEKTGKTVQQAINDALDELGLSADDVVIEVLDEGESGGLLGLGRRPARVRITSEEPAEPAEPDEEAEQAGMPDENAEYYGDDEEYSGEPETPEEAETAAYVAAILSGIGIHGKISSYREDETLHIEVSGQDCGAAIGRHGETLEAIQYLASLVANKYSEERIRVSLDIGGYKRRRESSLISMAERAADKVIRSGVHYSLDPMNPAERRIIHSALQNFPGVTTYSEGEEPERHVVIAPSQDS
ncbi:MAG TPA: protein jag [Clostridiales bacterium]|nr:protein jag [Clostridiales bacterium]